MNSKQNKNESEILGVSQDCINTPNECDFENDPSQQLQNTNDKGLLNMCDQSGQFVGDASIYSSPEAYISAQDSIGFGVGLVSTILGVFGGPISITVGAIIGVITAILNFLPEGKDDNGKLAIWGSLIDNIRELINDAIDAKAMNEAKKILEDINNKMDEYNSKLNGWNESSKTIELNSGMATHFAVAQSAISTGVTQLTEQGHEVSFLPLFAIAANYHLLLLRDVSIYGSEWGMEDWEIKDYYSGAQGQLKKTQKYIDYAVSVYKEGLDKSKKIANSDKVNWERYNQYRRNMTIAVLDVIALFPTYDNHKYGKPTKVELSREVYTDMISYITNPFTTNPSEKGFPGYTESDFNEIEDALTRKPHLFTWLNQVTGYFYTQYARQQFMTAIQNKYHYTLSDDIITGSTHGVRYSGDTSASINLEKGEDIYSTKSSIFPLTTYDHIKELELGTARYFGVIGHNHSRTIGQNIARNEDLASIMATGPSSIISEIPYEKGVSPTADNYSHRLSYISAYATDCGAIKGIREDRGCHRTPQLCAWTHVSADPENRIATDKITQISAIKAYRLNDATVVKGPDFTGGDIIKIRIDEDGSDRIYIRINQPKGEFSIRLHYASSRSSQIFMSTGTGAVVKINLNGTFSGLREGHDLQYNEFEYVDTSFISIPGNQNIIIATPSISSAATVFINKLEFIPV